MTARWALEAGHRDQETELGQIVAELHRQFADGAATPREVPALARLEDLVRRKPDPAELDHLLRNLVHDGYLRGALTVLTSSLEQGMDPDVGIALARELLDAVDPPLGIRVLHALLGFLEQDADPFGHHAAANLMLGHAYLQIADAQAALRHYEAVLAIDVDHPQALRGWSAAMRNLEKRGLTLAHRSRGLALLDGLEDVDLGSGAGLERYEIGRPLGRGRHAVVYQAHDRHVGREVAIKRLLDLRDRRGSTPARVIEARFFREANTLARVRSPYVVALYDAQPRHRFIAMELCRGGNLVRALRRGLVGPRDVPRIGDELRLALAAVHAAGALHRDVKPANILVREPQEGSSIALADFGLAVDTSGPSAQAGTLRYLAPELRQSDGQASPASDLFSAGVVLLELARAPRGLPPELDGLTPDFDAASWVPDDLPGAWAAKLRSLLSADPEKRSW